MRAAVPMMFNVGDHAPPKVVAWIDLLSRSSFRYPLDETIGFHQSLRALHVLLLHWHGKIVRKGNLSPPQHEETCFRHISHDLTYLIWQFLRRTAGIFSCEMRYQFTNCVLSIGCKEHELTPIVDSSHSGCIMSQQYYFLAHHFVRNVSRKELVVNLHGFTESRHGHTG